MFATFICVGFLVGAGLAIAGLVRDTRREVARQNHVAITYGVGGETVPIDGTTHAAIQNYIFSLEQQIDSAEHDMLDAAGWVQQYIAGLWPQTARPEMDALVQRRAVLLFPTNLPALLQARTRTNKSLSTFSKHGSRQRSSPSTSRTVRSR